MRSRPFSLDLSRPLGTAHGEIRAREGFLLAVDPVRDGVRAPGLGEATPLPGWTEPLAACDAALARVGSAGGDLRDALTALDPAETPAARHGVALAVADAAARSAGRRLADHLAHEAARGTDDRPAEGSVASETAQTVPVNATIGDGDPPATAREAERAVEAGFGCLKVKVGAREAAADADRLRAVRRTVGDAVTIRVDANGAWDRKTARHALGKLSAFDLAYVEQPLPADDLAGTAALREAVDVADVPIAVDESVAVHGIDAVLNAGAADAVVLKPMALGGPDRALAAAFRAREADVEPVVTTTIDAVVARAAAVHVAAAIPDVAPCGLATAEWLAEDLAVDPCPVVGGRIEVPSGPGLAGGAFEALHKS